MHFNNVCKNFQGTEKHKMDNFRPFSTIIFLEYNENIRVISLGSFSFSYIIFLIPSMERFDMVASVEKFDAVMIM